MSTPLRFSTAGSVDDGKSTLIGRLLYDSKSILEDQLASVARSSERRGRTAPDLALLTDGLIAEREQGITIDVAYRYFATPRRKFIIADTPGHEQYTRNMVTGASTADLTIVLIDATRGVQPQSRRHALIASLLGIPHLVVAVNKMDLVDYSQARFEELRAAVATMIGPLSFVAVDFVPISALLGDNVVDKSAAMRWYRGPTLLALLEESNAARDPADAPFRLPVQRVSVPSAGSYHRGYMGRIESGRVRVGDTVRIAPSGQSARVRGLLTYDGALESATAPQSITILLDCELDISRGDVICSADCPMHALRSLPATLAWMDGEALAPHRRYLIKAGTRTVRARIEAIHARLDVTTLGSVPATDTLALNDIGEVTWRLQEPLALDDYGAVRSTGGFIVIDETSYRTVGAGVARLAQARDML